MNILLYFMAILIGGASTFADIQPVWDRFGWFEIKTEVRSVNGFYGFVHEASLNNQNTIEISSERLAVFIGSSIKKIVCIKSGGREGYVAGSREDNPVAIVKYLAGSDSKVPIFNIIFFEIGKNQTLAKLCGWLSASVLVSDVYAQRLVGVGPILDRSIIWTDPRSFRRYEIALCNFGHCGRRASLLFCSLDHVSCLIRTRVGGIQGGFHSEPLPRRHNSINNGRYGNEPIWLTHQSYRQSDRSNYINDRVSNPENRTSLGSVYVSIFLFIVAGISMALGLESINRRSLLGDMLSILCVFLSIYLCYEFVHVGLGIGNDPVKPASKSAYLVEGAKPFWHDSTMARSLGRSYIIDPRA